MTNYTIYLYAILILVITKNYVKCVEIDDNYEIETLREYLRIDTSPDQSFQKVVDFWKRQAEESGLSFAVHQPAGKPICVLTLQGSDPCLPSIMLNSHMDVVPVIPKDWIYPPFSAHMDEEGNIYARGAQDTKDVAIQYLMAVRRLKKDNVTLRRTVHITLMPDEETGGFQGVIPFVNTKEFKELNVGFALDEGLTSPSDESLFASYVDRRPWAMKFTVKGSGGHSFAMPHDLAVRKLQRLLNIMMEYREPLELAVKSTKPENLGTFTTININMVNGGLAMNVLPESFTVVADLRLSPKENATEIEAMVNSWAAYAGNGTIIEYLRKITEASPTAVDNSNPFWESLKGAVNDVGFELLPIVCPATSDMLILRNLGIPAIGFTTKHSTKPRLHRANEYINKDIFLKGIDIYVPIIKKLANTNSTFIIKTDQEEIFSKGII